MPRAPHAIVEENLRAAMSCFARSRPEGEMIDLPGLRLVYSAIGQAVFNAALLTENVDTVSELRRRLERARDFFGRRSQPWSLWLCEEWLTDREVQYAAASLFADAGLAFSSNPPGMIATRLASPRRVVPALEFRRIHDPSTRIDFCHVMSMAFEGPFATLMEAYNGIDFWEGEFTGWIGYRDGRAVTTACTVTTPASVGLYAVSTSPHEQRKGYAEAVMRHALSHHPEQPVVLQSSPAGLSLYKQLGFEIVSNITIWVST